MDFDLNDKTKKLLEKVTDFMEKNVYPNEHVAHEQIEASGNKHHHPQIIEDLKAKAKAAGLWNLFLPDKEHGAGLTNLEYAPLSEAMGRSQMGSEVFNCSAPDTGNMEILAEFGSKEQKKQWLEPLLDGKIRSCFSMTEPETAGSDPTLLQTRAERKGDNYGSGADLPPGFVTFVYPLEILDRNGRGIIVIPAHKSTSEKEIVPGVNKNQNCRRDYPGHCQG